MTLADSISIFFSRGVRKRDLNSFFLIYIYFFSINYHIRMYYSGNLEISNEREMEEIFRA